MSLDQRWSVAAVVAAAAVAAQGSGCCSDAWNRRGRRDSWICELKIKKNCMPLIYPQKFAQKFVISTKTTVSQHFLAKHEVAFYAFSFLVCRKK